MFHLFVININRYREIEWLKGKKTRISTTETDLHLININYIKIQRNIMETSILPCPRVPHRPSKLNHKVVSFYLTWWHKSNLVRPNMLVCVVCGITCVCAYGVCVCVWERERERESWTISGHNLWVSCGTISTRSFGLNSRAWSMNLFARAAWTPKGGFSPMIYPTKGGKKRGWRIY